jgi:nucleoside-diphosphate-sugar epimerase
LNFRKIHLTGAAGFIGSALNAKLEAQLSIPVIRYDYRVGLGILHPNKLLDEVSNGGCREDLVLHFGASADTRQGLEKVIEERNILYLKQLADAFKGGGGKLIFASSAAVYGNSRVHGTDQCSELGPYARSKRLGEEFLLDACVDRPNDLAILRLHNVYGPGELTKNQMMSIPSRFIVDALMKGQIRVWQSASVQNQSRDFIHVEDVINFILTMSRQEWKSQIIDVGTGVSTAIQSIAHTISTILGSEVILEEFPWDMDEKNYQMYTRADITPMQLIEPGFKPRTVNEALVSLIEHYATLL